MASPRNLAPHSPLLAFDRTDSSEVRKLEEICESHSLSPSKSLQSSRDSSPIKRIIMARKKSDEEFFNSSDMRFLNINPMEIQKIAKERSQKNPNYRQGFS
mmetsp:Transcript_19624/g.22310  ORF Transcript_19624/g.22310 Transcript_19624/m.22310 type:complete len:101 (-) Transcript_19624:627-929(-)